MGPMNSARDPPKETQTRIATQIALLSKPTLYHRLFEIYILHLKK